MRNTRNQLVIAIIFALLLGLIIVGATRCGLGSGSTPGSPTRTRTPTAVKTVKPGTGTPTTRVTGSPTVASGKSPTETVILPPGTQLVPTPTPISVGPQPITTPTLSGTPGTGQIIPPVQVVPTAAPVAPGTGSVQVPPGGTTYVVQRGDTLSAIAKKFGVTTTAIAQANNISNPSRIYAGQKLVIPGASSTGGTSTTGKTTYVVQKGDSISSIAKKFGVTVNAIVQANNLSNPNLIYAGQKLIIP